MSSVEFNRLRLKGGLGSLMGGVPDHQTNHHMMGLRLREVEGLCLVIIIMMVMVVVVRMILK